MKHTLPSLSLLLFLSACSALKPVKDTTVRHLLDPLIADRTLTTTTPAIAINRPSIPTYLDRMQLITRSDGQLMMSHQDLWAEPLDSGVSRVMASNLSRLTGSMNIQPVENYATLDYTLLLELKITQFEPDAAGHMILQGTWKLQPVTGKETSPHFFRFDVPISATPATMTDRVAAMNQALERLAREVFAKL